MQTFSDILSLIIFIIISAISAVFNFIFESPIVLGIVGVAIGVVIIVFLIRSFREVWLFYKRAQNKAGLTWTILEIRIPREVDKTPRAMEQFLMGIYGLRNAPGDFLETYIEGEVTLWWSLELVSFGGEIHFYIRTPKKYKKLIEAGMYAQYSNVEVEEVEDYMDTFPKSTVEIYKKGYNLFGGELILREDQIYPLKTYEHFELDKEEMALDPISSLLEVFSGLDKQEKVFLQILIRPADKEWQKEGKKLVDKLVGRKEKESPKSGGLGIGEFAKNLFMAPVEPPVWGGTVKEEKKDERRTMEMLTPGEREIVKAVEEKISKPGFETLIRYLYYAPNAIFSVNFGRRGLLGAVNQYASQALNTFKGNPQVETRARWIHFPHILVKQRVEARKQRMLENYRVRRMPEESSTAKFFTSHPMNLNFKSKSYILNTAEVATIYHIPTEKVLTAPHLKRVESKKMGPPAGLPIFSEEE